MNSAKSGSPKLWKRCGQNLVRYNPSGTYYVRARVSGKLHVKSLKTPVLAVARQRLGDEVRKLRAQAASLDAVGKGKMRMADAITVYEERLDANAHIKPRSKDYYKEALAALLKSWPELRDADVKRISERDCRSWAAKFFREYSANRSNNTLMVLRDLFDIAVESGMIYTNPARAVKRAKVRAKDLKLPSREEFLRFVEEIQTAGSRDSRNCADAVAFMAFSGSRLGEANAVTWRDVNFTRGELTVRGDAVTRTKNSEIRRVPMIPELQALLRRMRSERRKEPVDKAVLRVREAQRSMDRAANRVGMHRITHHDLRHLFATMAIESGVDVPTVSRLLGHKDGGALCMKTYGHLRDEHAREAVKKVRFGFDLPDNVVPMQEVSA
jgi:integrase